MKKIKYYYNTNSLRYEKLVTPLRVKLLRILGFLAGAIVTALIIVVIAFRVIDSPKEMLMRQENERIKDDYRLLNNKVKSIQQQMAELEKRDNHVYREIFEANPIPDSARAKRMEKQQEAQLAESMEDNELAYSIAATLDKMMNRIAFQKKSYQDIEAMIRDKEKMLAATPAIQPVSNKDLSRVASGFGYRIDPVYKTVKMHAGLDFAAPQGTPIYATADGVVRLAGNTGNGYGNHVIINHGYGYETLYGHQYRIKAKVGQKVKRGELIGWVGSTGKSTGPHLHYEVRKNKRHIDPIYFFYNDLTPEQFDRIVKIAASGNQSFD
ncbi:M23 family metallopeptidase [Agriterribacter sp.]|uniref:M23 family metallopeptidase n=1 Tax=Agriterribacter sp. TaxID=2821509 RepID=UPI002B5D169A|nr:M23 family metallopeptidase [Agriterribacter sp.]HRO44531.1 M23 family metallopeptidase [Agriterribacter sp.]HRQ16443.1 M23 family metallopeptidase [Agriterribacter sp.]